MAGCGTLLADQASLPGDQILSSTTSAFNEEARLASLRSLALLDTPGEERFDRITRLAQQLFNVAFAGMSLLDRDRAFFKSRHR